MSPVHRPLEGKVAIVTGGASGIGRAAATRFLDEGARVVVGDLNQANGDQLLEEAEERGVAADLRFRRGDVTDEEYVEGLIAFATAELGPLDVIFCNAGARGAVGPIDRIALDDWRWTMDLLCGSVFLGTKHAARAMRAAGKGGSIICTASLAGSRGGYGPVPYTTAKAGVLGFVRAVSPELAADRIRINAISPGAITTPLNVGDRRLEDHEALWDEAQPWPEHGRPEDIASLAVFLASEDSRFITGADMVVDGGLSHTTDFGERFGTEAAPPGVAGLSVGNTGAAQSFIRRGG